MSCTKYDKLQRRCESRRKKMSHFMQYKPLQWQADPIARNFVKGTQAAILRATAEITTHQDNCPICNSSSEINSSRNPPSKDVSRN